MATRRRRERPVSILFDLDGTLIDSIGLIINSARYAFEKHGREWVTDSEWASGIGIPLPTMFMRYARDVAERDALIAAYREYQLANHDRLVSCYEDARETVRDLRSRGHELAVVTSKSEWLAYRALALVGLACEMETVVGLGSSTRHKPDPEPVRIALQRLDCPPARALFVGDSVHDVMAGNAAGVATVAATWGAFARADLEPGRPTHWLERISDLPHLVSEVI